MFYKKIDKYILCRIFYGYYKKVLPDGSLNILDIGCGGGGLAESENPPAPCTFSVSQNEMDSHFIDKGGRIKNMPLRNVFLFWEHTFDWYRSF